jgi:hypothetical protein
VTTSTESSRQCVCLSGPRGSWQLDIYRQSQRCRNMQARVSPGLMQCFRVTARDWRSPAARPIDEIDTTRCSLLDIGKNVGRSACLELRSGRVYIVLVGASFVPVAPSRETVVARYQMPFTKLINTISRSGRKK